MADFDAQPSNYVEEPDPPSDELLSAQMERERLKRQIGAAIELGCIDQMRLVRKFYQKDNPFLSKEYVMSVVQEVMHELVDKFRNHDIYADAFKYVNQNAAMIELLTDEMIVVNEEGDKVLNTRIKNSDLAAFAKTVDGLWASRFGFLEKLGVTLEGDEEPIKGEHKAVDTEEEELKAFEAEEEALEDA